MKTSSASRKPRPMRREYDIARRVDGQFGIYRWLPCPNTPPLLQTPSMPSLTGEQMMAYNAGTYELKVVHIHRRWVIVAVRQSFKAALKWTRAQQQETRDAAAV